MKFFLLVLIMWFCTVVIVLVQGRIWRTGVRTGRWLLSDGRSYHFPSKYYTFLVYDRIKNRCMYRLAVTISPIVWFGLLSTCVLLRALFVRNALAWT
jgi:hypothetical protein